MSDLRPIDFVTTWINRSPASEEPDRFVSWFITLAAETFVRVGMRLDTPLERLREIEIGLGLLEGEYPGSIAAFAEKIESEWGESI